MRPGVSTTAKYFGFNKQYDNTVKKLNVTAFGTEITKQQINQLNLLFEQVYRVRTTKFYSVNFNRNNQSILCNRCLRYR